jgi:hypothetical protein
MTVASKRRHARFWVFYFHVFSAWTLDVVVSTVVTELDAHSTL